MATTYRDMLARLGVMQAVYKAVAARVSTKDPDSLRADVDEQLTALYNETGTTQTSIVMNGEKVGTLSLRMSKPRKGNELVVTDRKAFEQWALNEDYATVRQVVTFYNPEDNVLTAALQAGEIPDGCELRAIDEPAQILGTTILGCEPEKVVAALGDGVTAAVAGALTAGGGE